MKTHNKINIRGGKILKETEIIAKLKNRKDEGFKVVLISVIMALGINFLAFGISNIFNINNAYLIIGFLMIFISITILTLNKYKSLNRIVNLKGFFIYNKKDKRLLRISEYGISEDMVRYMESAFSENPALKNLWENNDINNMKVVGESDDKHLIAICSESTILLLELIEYCIIEKLSTFVGDYFNLLESKKKKTKTYCREDVPDIILKNRFLKLFSEPMKNRIGFMTDENFQDTEIKTVSAYGKNGHIFNSFDLTLPIKSKVSKSDANTIIIDMNGFAMKVSFLYGGFSTNIENSFYEHYLSMNNNSRIFNPYQFNIKIEIKFKLKSLLYIGNWNHYEWIDLFLDKLTHYLDKDTFFKDINWELSKSIIRCMKSMAIKDNN